MTKSASSAMAVNFPLRGRSEEHEWTVLVTVAAALVLGLLVQALATGQTTSARAAGVSISYPARWAVVEADGRLLAAQDVFGGPFAPRVAVAAIRGDELTADPEAGLGGAAQAWALRLSQRDLSGFQLIRTVSGQLAGRDTQTLEYVFLERGRDGRPALMRATDTIVREADGIYILTFAAEDSRFAELSTPTFPLFRDMRADILRSWRFH